MIASERIEDLRRAAGSAVVESFFRGLSRVASLHPNARPERHGVIVERDIPYVDRPGPEHRLDVYRPQHDAPGPRPVVMYVHGGGFRILSKDTHWLMGLAFARRGYVVFNVDYRLAPRHPFPAALEDASDALCWVARNAHRWGGDPTRIVLAGESAGANLVAALTLACCYERDEPYAKRVFELGIVPRATLPACGIFQVSDVQRFARRKKGFPRFVMDRLEEVSHAYLGRDHSAYGTSLDLADPVCFLERAQAPSRPLPPFFLPVGTKDPLLDDTRRLARAVEALGGEAMTKIYPGEVHAFHAFVFRASARRCWQEMLGFLDEKAPA
ncbi:alpha/beta hydrolase [Sandaracinus amylolyticus]|uniref:Esterase/lipase n=1 Tax=Sandaracinus amylolyticus TaxID=927083 RepID=A0A0F6SI57_9BACT|nr:alpha/beta hydrolase [Sandaracinus amylolyticus]AKF11614.1 Esterase/lipase [Sandaracinus amylolyticus]